MYHLGTEPVKFMALTNAPFIMKGFGSADFMFNCPYAFREMYSGDDDTFFVESNVRYQDGRPGRQSNIWETNFIRDEPARLLAFYGTSSFTYLAPRRRASSVRARRASARVGA